MSTPWRSGLRLLQFPIPPSVSPPASFFSPPVAPPQGQGLGGRKEAAQKNAAALPSPGLSANTHDAMGHLQTVEAKLRELIAEGDEEALVRFVKDKVLESYRNGL